MMKFALAATMLCGVLGCSGDDGAIIDAAIDTPPSDCGCGNDAVDAPDPIDAPPSTVVVVDCAGAQIASEVTTPGFNFAITQPLITTGDTVRFTMPGFHTATSGTVTGGVPTPDGNFRVPFGATVCLHFTAPGDFPFYCEPHLFTGMLGVRDPV